MEIFPLEMGDGEMANGPTFGLIDLYGLTSGLNNGPIVKLTYRLTCGLTCRLTYGLTYKWFTNWFIYNLSF